MAHILTNNAFEEDKFKFLTDEGRHHDKNSLKKNEKDQQKQKPIISPRYDTEIESNLTTKKVSMKDLYEILPFKK